MFLVTRYREAVVKEEWLVEAKNEEDAKELINEEEGGNLLKREIVEYDNNIDWIVEPRFGGYTPTEEKSGISSSKSGDESSARTSNRSDYDC